MKAGRYLFKIFFIIILVGGSYPLLAQPNSLYFMKGIPQTKDLNPARPGITDGFYISMPLFSKLDLAANTNNWTYNDLIQPGTGTQANSLVFDLDKFSRNIENQNFAFESAALTLLEGGFRQDKNFYALSWSEREFGQVHFDKKLVDLIKYGNYPYLGKTYNVGQFGINAQHYREFAFNYSHDVTKKLTIGFAAKLLFGMGAIQTNAINLRTGSPANGEYLNISASGRANISAPIQFNYNPLLQKSSVNIIPNYTIGAYLKNFNNPGFATDLGLAYQVNKRTELSVSVIDLGMISWGSHLTRLNENGHSPYQGINNSNPSNLPVSDINPLIRLLSNAIVAALHPDSTGTRFSTSLPTKIYMGVDYQLSKAVSLSGLTRFRMINSTLRTSLTASANALIGNDLSLSASYSIMESTYDNLGLGIGIKEGPVQLYAAADNLFSPFYPENARNMNLRLGINFIFNNTKERKRKGGKGINPNCHCPY